MAMERSLRSWTTSDQPEGGTSGDDAILNWLQEPGNAARFIRYWNGNIKAERMMDFIADIRSYVNRTSSPPRSSEATYKRIQRWNQLLKLGQRLLQEGATEDDIVEVFPNYHGFVACLKRGMTEIRNQEEKEATATAPSDEDTGEQQQRHNRLKSPPLQRASSAMSNLSADSPTTITPISSSDPTPPITESSSTRLHNQEGECVPETTSPLASPSSSPRSAPMTSSRPSEQEMDQRNEQRQQDGDHMDSRKSLPEMQRIIKLLRRKSRRMHHMMKTIQLSEKRRLYVEQRKYRSSRAAEMQTQIELIQVMKKAGFSRNEILSAIHKQAQPNNE